MIPEFHTLDDSEIELVLKAPILVCILIAGADGTIDRKEIKEAIAVTQAHKNSNSPLSQYFKIVADDFEDKVKIVLQAYPHEADARNPLIIEELSGLNVLWNRLDKNFSVAFYEMLLTLAGKIASSSGGLLGMRTVDAEEAKYLKLSMLTDPSKI
jgi:hypothetical protein